MVILTQVKINQCPKHPPHSAPLWRYYATLAKINQCPKQSPHSALLSRCSDTTVVYQQELRPRLGGPSGLQPQRCREFCYFVKIDFTLDQHRRKFLEWGAGGWAVRNREKTQLAQSTPHAVYILRLFLQAVAWAPNWLVPIALRRGRQNDALRSTLKPF